MKKTTKLLSVLLAFVMALSCMTMMASAAGKTKYQTVADLDEGLQAYSPYGTVTRLNSEERLSIVFDALDQLLGGIPNSKMNVPVVGDIDYGSINGIFKTVDRVQDLLGTPILGAIAKSALGDVGKIGFSKWTAKQQRENTAQIAMLDNLLTLLSDSGTQTTVYNVIKNGKLNLGLVGSFVSIDLSVIADIPGLVKGLVFPLFSRPDDDATLRDKYQKASADLITTAEDFVNGLFTKPMNWTSVRADKDGNITNQTVVLPTESDGTSRYFDISADKKTITQYDYSYDKEDYEVTAMYELSEKPEVEGGKIYLFNILDGFSGDATLKYFKAENVADVNTGNIQSSYWLPTVRDAINNNELKIELNGAKSALDLLYAFIPYVFGEMAPTVLNGSVKKLLAGLFDVEFEFIGKKGDASLPSGEFFTKAQEYYTWEYSDYMVDKDGTPYYRFQDDFYKGIIPENISTYYYMFDWDWHVGDDFMNKYIPGRTDATTTFNTILKSLNNFVADVLDLALVDTITLKDGTVVNLTTSIGWQRGDNSKIVDNALRAARAIFNLVPTEIFDEFVDDPELSPYYDLMMNGETPQKALTGLLAAVIEMVMPQIILPTGAQLANVPFIALGALVVRELCTQLMPTYNFDAMIYSDYNTKTLVTKTADQWLDTILYMGVNLGMFYLRNIADVGEDDEVNGYYGAMAKLHALPAATPDAMTFAADAAYIGSVPTWQYLVDWVVDWALSNEVEWAWHFERLVTVDGTVELKSYQDPWAKINSVLLQLLPLNRVLYAGTADEAKTNAYELRYGGKTFTETILRTKLVNSIINLDVPTLVSIFDVKADSTNLLTQQKIAETLIGVIRDMLNYTLRVVSGGINIIPTNITTIEGTNGVLTNANLATIVKNILSKILTARQNGLLDPVLPIVNFFVGWTTDAQKYADPTIITKGEWGDNYINKNCANHIYIANASSGMLQKHRNSNQQDQSYDIVITGINITGNTGISLANTFAETTVAPGTNATFDLNVGSLVNGVAKIDVQYQFKSKVPDANNNSVNLGGLQTKTIYVYCSTFDDEENVKEAESSKKDQKRPEYNKYVFTKDVFGAVTDYVGSITNTSKVNTNSTKKLASCGTEKDSKNVTWPVKAPASTYFRHVANITEAKNNGWAASYKKDETVSGKLFFAKDGVNASTLKNAPYGTYDMGKVNIKYKDAAMVWDVDFIYYNDYNISDVMNEYMNKNVQKSQCTNEADFNDYETKLMKVVELAEYPKMVATNESHLGYVDGIMPQIEGAISALKEAYQKLVFTNTTTTASLKSALDAIETNPAKDIDFEDHQLFEYFQYEKLRKSSREMIAATTGPVAPEKYIKDENLNYDTISAIIAANTGIVATGINKTVQNPTQEDMDAYLEAVQNFKPATYSALHLQDQIAKLNYYAAFMQANPRDKGLDYKAFLNKEIAAANAQGYKQADYSADSWNAYTDALANANAIAGKANAEYSEVFDAKYELMKAERDLMPAYASMKKSGYLDQEIIPLIEHAKAIIDNYGSIYAVKAGITEADAFAQLVKALGVAYDVTVDGVKHEGILYDHSALTFQAYDRVASYKNKIVVDNAADKLRAAIENFESTAKLEAKDETTAVDQTVRFIQGIVPGSIANAEQLLARVTVTGGNAVTSASKAGNYGTGARIEIKSGDILLATYFVVIYGDVNGDGAVDAFDAIEVDVANCTAHYMGDVYDDAADLTNDGKIDAADYAALVAGVKCDAAISQNPNA